LGCGSLFLLAKQTRKFMLNDLELAREKLRQFNVVLHDFVKNAEKNGVSKDEYEEMTNLVLDAINQTKRRIQILERKKNKK
jgi:hypothetical protein